MHKAMESGAKEVFRIVALPAVPYVQPCFTNYPKGCPLPGTEIWPIIKILEIAQIPFSLINPGNDSELHRQICNDEVDILGATESLLDFEYKEYLQPRHVAKSFNKCMKKFAKFAKIL